MNTIRSHIEAPPLPEPVPFFELRRELRGITPPRAFWIGVACGSLAGLVVWVLAQ
jgi:hypothetical protein